MSARTGLAAVDAEAITLRRVDITAGAGPVLAVRDSREVSIEGGAAAPGTGVFLRVDGAGSGMICLSNVDLKNATTPIEMGTGVAPGAVTRK